MEMELFRTVKEGETGPVQQTMHTLYLLFLFTFSVKLKPIYLFNIRHTPQHHRTVTVTCLAVSYSTHSFHHLIQHILGRDKAQRYQHVSDYVWVTGWQQVFWRSDTAPRERTPSPPPPTSLCCHTTTCRHRVTPATRGKLCQHINGSHTVCNRCTRPLNQTSGSLAQAPKEVKAWAAAGPRTPLVSICSLNTHKGAEWHGQHWCVWAGNTNYAINTWMWLFQDSFIKEQRKLWV